MIYLASPYTHKNPDIQVARFDAVCRVTSVLLKLGHVVFSPIAYSHQFSEYGIPNELDFWLKFDAHFINKSSELWVLTIDGWKESVGVKAEIELAIIRGIPVKLVDEKGNVSEWS